MTRFSPRLPHMLTRSDLAYLLSPTYAREGNVSEELAQERLGQAFERSGIPGKIYEAVSIALESVRGSRTEDELMDVLSKAVPKRWGHIVAAPATPALSAVTVLIHIELGLAPEDLRATLESDKGSVLLDRGFRALGENLVEQLIR